MTEPRCTYDAERGWLTPEHARDCNDVGCAGCRPCPKSHCGLRGCPEHVEQHAGIYTCPRCIGKVRRRVQRIAELYALVDLDVELRGADLGPLLAEAVDDGIASEAFNLIGPAADPGQYGEKRARLRSAYEGRGWCDWPRHEGFHDDDPQHPYAVLGRWDMACRESYGPATDLFVSVSRAADYLSGPLLDTFAHTSEFEDFDRETAECLSHLEGVLHDSRAPEKGAPCPTCRATTPDRKAQRLVKHYAEHARDGGQLKHGPLCHCGDDATGHCRICAGHEDTWHCPANAEHWWSDADYRNRVDGDYQQHATALTADQAAERFGIKASVIRVWGARGRIRKRGRNQYGITLYDVEDIATRCAARAEVLAPTAGQV